MKRRTWRALFLGATAIPLGMEVIASILRVPHIEPWTTLIVEYIPGVYTFVGLTLLYGWAIIHFFKRYPSRK